MRLGLMAGYSGATIDLPMEMIKAADRLGYYAVWTAEAYGSDAVTPLAWIGAQTEQIRLGTAIMQMPARTPAMTAMTAATLDQLSAGRMLLGLGLSGPQVVEGWHGVPYGKPLAKTREYVEIVRTILARKEALVHTGAHYQIPYTGDDATGLGKPLKSIIHGRADIPIYLAAIGPKNVELCAEIADGWLPIFFSPAHFDATYREQVEAGFAKAGGGKSFAEFDVAPSVNVVVSDDVDAARNSLKPALALYVGGMGAKEKNFYYNLVCRYGFEDAADEIQAHFLAGRKAEAAAAVPDDLVDLISLCGPKARIKERLAAWEKAPVTTLNLWTYDLAGVEVMAELALGVDTTRTVMDMAQAEPDAGEQSPAGENPAGENAESAGARQVFTRMTARVAENPNLVKRVNALFQFHISGDTGGDWIVDLKHAPGDVRSGVIDAADCTIRMTDADFVELASGRLNPMAAFAQGKVKIDGNPMLATKLQGLFG
ncbi:MAG: LLM class F420-dependent oxidoreductase [Caldilineaceae bacterium]|nr:LLM class F420-dependent oxidoreductase [Caldilineaceae bacterium]